MAKYNEVSFYLPSVQGDSNDIAITYRSWGDLYNWYISVYCPSTNTYKNIKNENGEITVEEWEGNSYHL